MSDKNATYTFEIHNIDVFPDLFEVTASVTQTEGSPETTSPGVYILEFRKNQKYEMTKCIATWMHDNKDNKKCPGTEIKKTLKINEKKFYNRVYYSFWSIHNLFDERIGETGLFTLKNIADGKVIDDLKIRCAFSQAFFQRNNGKTSDNSFYWLGDEKKTTVDFPQQPDSIFSDEFQQYVRFECRTEDLDHDILTDARGGFKITEAEEKLEPVKREVNKELDKYLKAGQNVLIQGPPAVGKTRLVFDGLGKLENCHIFSLSRKAFLEASSLTIPENINQEKKHLIWFIDDLQKLLELGLKGDIDTIHEDLTDNLENISVIATTRSGQHPVDTKYFKEMIKDIKVITLEKWTPKEGEALIKLHGYPTERISKFDGTPLSIIKGADSTTMQGFYDLYIEKGNWNNVYVLRYLMLLREFLDLVDHDLLKDVYHDIRKQSQNTDDFEDSINKLEKDGFLVRKEGYIDSWDIYFEEIVTNGDYSGFGRDIEGLIFLLSKLRKFWELIYLGFYFDERNDFKNAIICFEQIIDNIGDRYNKKLRSISYKNLGNALDKLERFEEAREKYEKAIEINPKSACMYNSLGCSLANSARFEEACVKFEKAATLNPEDANVVFNLGNALAALERFEEAREKYEKAIEINPENAIAHYNLGSTLAKLAKLTNNKIDPEKIINKYAMAFVLFILQKEWKDAVLASGRILNGDVKPEDVGMDIYKILLVFNMALSLILNPRKISHNEMEKLKTIERIAGNIREPLVMVFDAIFENKKTDIEVDPKNNDLVLNAAIVLANEIVATSSQTA